MGFGSWFWALCLMRLTVFVGMEIFVAVFGAKGVKAFLHVLDALSLY